MELRSHILQLLFARGVGSLKLGLINGGSSFFAPVNDGWMQRCEQLGATCYQTFPGDDKNYNGTTKCEDFRTDVINRWLELGLDGLAMKPCGNNFSTFNNDTVKELGALNIPVVYIDRDFPESQRAAYVGTDQEFLGRTMARLLRQLRPEGGTYAFVGRKAVRDDGFIAEISKYNDRDDRSHWYEVEGDYLGWSLLSDEELDSAFIIYNNKRAPGGMIGVMERAVEMGATAIIFLSQSPMKEDEYEAFVDKHREKGITYIGTDGSDFQLDFLSRRYVDGLVGQLPFEFGTESAQLLHDIITNGNIEEDEVITNIVAYNLIPVELPYLKVDQNLLGNLKIVGFVCFGIVVFSVIVCITWTIMNRTKSVVRAAQPFFLNMVAVGVLIMSASLIPLSADDGGDLAPETHTWSLGVCMSVPWLAFTGFSVAFSALFSKTWRVNRIMKAKTDHLKIKLSARDVMTPFFVLLSLNCLVLILWTAIDPLEYKRQEHDGTDYWNRVISTYGACRSDNAVAYLLPLAVINFSVVALSCWQAVEARDIQSEFAETKYIGLAVASLFQAFLTGIPVIVVVRDMPQAYYLMMSVMVFLLSMVLLWLIFLPKILMQRRYSTMTEEEQRKELAKAVQNNARSSSFSGGPGSSAAGFRGRSEFGSRPEEAAHGQRTPSTATPEDLAHDEMGEPIQQSHAQGKHTGRTVGVASNLPVVSELTKVQGLESSIEDQSPDDLGTSKECGDEGDASNESSEKPTETSETAPSSVGPSKSSPTGANDNDDQNEVKVSS